MALTTKYRMAEQAKRILEGGNSTQDSQLSIRELMLFVSQAFGQVARMRFFENKAEGDDYINGDFIFSFPDIPVTVDQARGEYYAILPSNVITLPRDLGVYHVSLMKDQTRPFVPVANGFNAMFRGLEAGQLEGRSGFYKEQEKIYFVNVDDIDGVEKVLIKLVAPLGSVGDEDVVSVPEDVQLEVVTMAVELYRLQQQVEQDLENDNIK